MKQLQMLRTDDDMSVRVNAMQDERLFSDIVLVQVLLMTTNMMRLSMSRNGGEEIGDWTCVYD